MVLGAMMPIGGGGGKKISLGRKIGLKWLCLLESVNTRSSFGCSSIGRIWFQLGYLAVFTAVFNTRSLGGPVCMRVWICYNLLFFFIAFERTRCRIEKNQTKKITGIDANNFNLSARTLLALVDFDFVAMSNSSNFYAG